MYYIRKVLKLFSKFEDVLSIINLKLKLSYMYLIIQ